MLRPEFLRGRQLVSRLGWYAILAAAVPAGIYAPPAVIECIFLILAVALVAAALVTIYWIAGLLKRLWLRRWLLKHGTSIRGRVIEAQLWASPCVGIDYEGPSRLVVEIVPDGAPLRVELNQMMDVDLMPEVGDDVTILYDARRPHRARLAPSFWRDG
jgi:hypothetical protein